jgi:hypothetical protein
MAWLEKGAACSVTPGAAPCDWPHGANCNAGKCRVQGPAGTPCDNADDCDTLACSDAGTCFGYADAGEACTWLGTPQVPPCAPGLWCDSQLDVGHCLALGATGAACFANTDCQKGLKCGPSSDAGFGMGRCTSPLPLGATCGTQTTSDCATGLFCDYTGSTGTCAALPTQGQPCVSFSSGCAAGLLCTSTDGGSTVCMKLSCLGQTCGDGMNACGAGVCAQGKCAPQPTPVDKTCAP